MTTTATGFTSNQSQQRKEPVQLAWVRLAFKFLNKVSLRITCHLAFNLFCTPRRTSHNPFPKELTESASEHYITFEGKRLKVYAWGFHGPKILLVHGWESQASTYRIMIPSLLKRGFSVVTFDAPAHGKSGGKRITMPRYGKAIKTVIDHYKFDGGIKYLIGHSFGGISSAWASAHYQIPIERLVFVSMPTNVERLISDFCHFLKLSDKIGDLMIRKIEQLTSQKIESFSVLNFKDEIPCRDILLVHDVQDATVPYSHFEELGNQWDTPKYITTSSLGHNKTIKDPEIIGKITNFLTA